MSNAGQHRYWVAGIRQRVESVALALALVPTIVMAQTAQAQTFTTLYKFTGGTDGGNPYGSLIRNVRGDLYGTTNNGGDLLCGAPYGCGTVFKLHGHKETVIHSFTGSKGDGAHPSSGLIWDEAGNLYGTTTYGGLPYCPFTFGCGTVFKIDKADKETVVYSFCLKNWPCADGYWPVAGLVRDPAGNLYGTAPNGGIYFVGGTVFKLDNTGKLTVLRSFDQGGPYAGLIRDAEGDLYSTTIGDGLYGGGTVFKMHGHTETVLYSFGPSQFDGFWPFGRLTRDEEGTFYGTTEAGGSYTCGGVGCGTVFKLDKSRTATFLHRFATDGKDGVSPVAGLVRDSNGNLYGTTPYGGIYGNGTVFKLDKTGKETILHSFTGGVDGEVPLAELIRDAAGNLYGTASAGGDPNCNTVYGTGCGVVFKITP